MKCLWRTTVRLEVLAYLGSIYEAVADQPGWSTPVEIAKAAGLSDEIARRYLARFVTAGLFEERAILGRSFYRLSK
jgi:DNA-binding IclR family transcriptional regulator